MPKLKNRILVHMIFIFLLMSVLLTGCSIQILRNIEKIDARRDADKMFTQVSEMLEDNDQEVDQTQLSLSATLLEKCDSVAYFLNKDLSYIDTVETSREFANALKIDEINIFDSEGKIYKGTHPEYYGYTMDSGEQISFFKPMLTDKSLRLVQDLIPNTASSIMMQYAAIWDLSKSFIIEVGMNQNTIKGLTQTTELSYIFKMVKPSPGIALTAVDKNTGLIVGSTYQDYYDQDLTILGFENVEQITNSHQFNNKYEGIKYYSITKAHDDVILIYSINNSNLYQSLPSNILLFFGIMLIISTIFITIIIIYLDRFVIKNIRDINSDLTAISDGDTNIDIVINNSLEFSELCSHINEMVDSIFASKNKLGFVINKTNTKICIYEYNEMTDHITFNSYGGTFLPLSKEELRKVTKNSHLFIDYVNSIKQNVYSEEENIFKITLDNNQDIYVKIEEYHDEKETSNVFGIIFDVSKNVYLRQRIESERDIDALTGILNRRSMHEKLNELFKNEKELKCGALCMIDADSLKQINDKYGHDDGDIYLQELANHLNNYGSRQKLLARFGGDEFVLFLYQYENDEELNKDIEILKQMQDNIQIELSNNIHIPLKFSVGYVKLNIDDNYHELLRIADELMYENKAHRKQNKMD